MSTPLDQTKRAGNGPRNPVPSAHITPEPAKVTESAADLRAMMTELGIPDDQRAAATLGRLRIALHQIADTYATTATLPPERRLHLLETDIRAALTELIAHEQATDRTR